MTISEKNWKNYISRLRKLNDKAAELMRQYIEKHGTANRKALIDYAYAVATKYGEGSASLAAAMYDAIAEASGVRIPSAIVAETATYKEVAITVNGTLKRGNTDILCDAVGSLVKKAGADTMLQNASRKSDHGKAEFAWIPSGDTCPYCLMLASNGWQKISKDTLKGGHAEHIHANCDCNYAVRFTPNGGVRGYDPDAYKKEFDGAEGDTWEDKLNYLRRQQYAENKDEINAQKRAAYAERKQREREGQPTTTN